MAPPAPGQGLSIQPGTSADLDSVMHVMTSAFGTLYGEAWTRSQCAGILPMSGVALRLARDKDANESIGFSLARRAADEAELLLIAVHPTEQRRGVGRLLLDDFIDQARSSGVRRAHLEVRDGNPAMSMYQTAGFNAVGRRRRYYHGGDGSLLDALTFVKVL